MIVAPSASDLVTHLRRAGYGIASTASSGEEALAVLSTSTPDFILPDLILLDGCIELATRLHTEFDLPVVLAAEDAGRAGSFGFVAKPFEAAAMRGVIELALDRHKIAAKLRARESWLATVLRAVHDITIVTDPGGRVQAFNPRAELLLGLPLAEAIGLPVGGVVHLMGLQTPVLLEELVSAALRQRTKLTLPPCVLLHGGDRGSMPVEGEITPGISNGRAHGAVIVLRDRLGRDHAERELRHDRKLLAAGRRAGGVAHDLNNLFTVILSCGERLRRDLSAAGRETPAEYNAALLDGILDAARSAAGIAQQLRDLTGKGVVPVELVDAGGAVERIAVLLRASMGSAVKLRTWSAPDTGKLKINPGQFDQILMNLILNARDAMPRCGNILVSTSRVRKRAGNSGPEEDYVRILVADTGPGIAPGAMERLFEPYYTTRPDGTGLGLPIVRSIVTEAGGRISAESGGGAVFEVLLPRVEADDQGQSRERNSVFGHHGENRTVLLVEDQPAILALLRDLLQEEGYQTLTATGAEEALDTARAYKGHIDLLITDISMPEVDGRDLAGFLSALRPLTKVLFISGYARIPEELPGDARKAVFLQKPFTPDDLLQKLHQLFQPG
ncbi:MAG: response regulator [Acidobacteriota bacterium]